MTKQPEYIYFNPWSSGQSINLLEEEERSISIEYVIDADGNMIPYERVLEKIEITKEHWVEIDELVRNLDKDSVKKIRNKKVT
ncbi:hypothetical protein [Brevibacillus sp. 179-C9.3 HS]|uniref:hypothetical protein n=1 Tax=unclassified Brevibacillus TaxID=2684853 RepID=UPI0039A394D1